MYTGCTLCDPQWSFASLLSIVKSPLGPESGCAAIWTAALSQRCVSIVSQSGVNNEHGLSAGHGWSLGDDPR